jgi:capsular polysaccharide transport system permease protein
LRRLDETLALGKTFADSTVDRISRFGGLDLDTSFEALHRYYQRKVTVQLDGASSIATLTVRAFSAEHAQAINRQLLDLGEQLVNGLNARGRQDMIQFAQNEVAEAERKAKAAALALSSYRSEKGVIDPERQSTIQLQQIGKLQDELIATKIQLAQVSSLSKDNPQVQSLNRRVQSLQDEIDRENARVTGGRTSLVGKAAEFQRFALEREFADKQLAIALSSLENARNEAQRKQLYLERIVQPSVPDVATEPRRVRAILAVFLLGLVTWGVLAMLIAGIREHQD